MIGGESLSMCISYSRQGAYAKSLEWYEKALPIREKMLGTEHPDTAETYNNVALVYYHQGDYEKALSIREKVFGKEHVFTKQISDRIVIIESLL